MREIVFMWIAAIAGFVTGLVVGRSSKRNARDWANEPLPWPASMIERHVRKQAPGAASEPEEMFVPETTASARAVLQPRPVQAMSTWDATRDDEQRETFRPAEEASGFFGALGCRVERLPSGGIRLTNEPSDLTAKPER